MKLETLIFYLTSFLLCYVKCFDTLDGFVITKELDILSKYYCLIKTDFKLDGVTCERCILKKTSEGYELKTVGLQKINVFIKHKIGTLEVPFILDCNKIMNYDAKISFKSTTTHNSILLKMYNSMRNGFLLFYTDGIKSYSKKIHPTFNEYEINDLKENTYYEVCVTGINSNEETNEYSCKKIKTGALLCKNAIQMNYFNTKLKNNLVSIKWSLKINANCTVKELQIKLSKNRYSPCLQQIVIRKSYTPKINDKTTKNCAHIRTIKYNQVNDGEILNKWRISSIYWKLFALTNDENIQEIRHFSSVNTGKESDYVAYAKQGITGKQGIKYK